MFKIRAWAHERVLESSKLCQRSLPTKWYWVRFWQEPFSTSYVYTNKLFEEKYLTSYKMKGCLTHCYVPNFNVSISFRNIETWQFPIEHRTKRHIISVTLNVNNSEIDILKEAIYGNLCPSNLTCVGGSFPLCIYMLQIQSKRKNSRKKITFSSCTIKHLVLIHW